MRTSSRQRTNNATSVKVVLKPSHKEVIELKVKKYCTQTSYDGLFSTQPNPNRVKLKLSCYSEKLFQVCIISYANKVAFIIAILY